MNVCVIVNEHSGSADHAAALRSASDARRDVTCRFSRQKGNARELAAMAAADGFDVVAAAGGDGTVNEVVNGLMQVDERPALGVLPIGTGNDFARMLTMPIDDPVAALELLVAGEQRAMDLIQMRSTDGIAYGVNAAAGGFSGKVSEALTSEMKAGLGPMAYLIGAATLLPDLRDYDTCVVLDGRPPMQVCAVNVVVANGRTLAGGKRVAPLANPEDGLLDVIVIRAGTVKELADAATRLVAGNLAAVNIVDTYRARRVRVESKPAMWFNLDGDLVTNEPVEFEVVPGAIRVVVGTDYQAVIDP